MANHLRRGGYYEGSLGSSVRCSPAAVSFPHAQGLAILKNIRSSQFKEAAEALQGSLLYKKRIHH